MTGKKSWIMEGTRKNYGALSTWPRKNEHRYLAHFRTRGVPDYIVQIVLPEPAEEMVLWLTYDDTEAVDSAEDGPLTSPREEEEIAGMKGEGKGSRRQKRQRRQNDMTRRLRHWTAARHEV